MMRGMGGGATLRISTGEASDTFVLHGEIDIHTAPQIADVPVPSTGQWTRLTLDVADVTFIDSIGIWALVNLSRRLDGGTLVITNPSPEVRRTLDLVDLSGAAGIVVHG
jgi:anti-anti-sigma factor